MDKLCTKCGETKELEAYNKDKTKSDNLYPSCRDCVNQQKKGYRAPNHLVNNRRYERTTRRDQYRADPKKYLWAVAKSRAKKFGVEFTIKPSDIVLYTTCPVTGEELDCITNNIRTGMSLDRIDNSRGYIPGNVAIISRRANLRKSDLTIGEVKNLLKYMENSSG